MEPTPACDAMRKIGQWNAAWDPFFELDPVFTDELSDAFVSNPRMLCRPLKAAPQLGCRGSRTPLLHDLNGWRLPRAFTWGQD
jgi:hypothetical protein